MKVSLEQVHERWTHRLKPYERALSAMLEDVDKVEERIILIVPADAGRSALFEIRQSEGREPVNPLSRLRQCHQCHFTFAFW